MRHARNAVAAMVIVALMLGVAGCSSSASSDESSAGSRATLYDSIDELAADSTAIINGIVTDQFTEGDTTVSVIPVDNAPFAPSSRKTSGRLPRAPRSATRSRCGKTPRRARSWRSAKSTFFG